MTRNCRIRLEADTLNELKAAIADLQKQYGKRFTASNPQSGRAGGFFSYGTLSLPEPSSTVLNRLHDIAEESAMRRLEQQTELKPDEN